MIQTKRVCVYRGDPNSESLPTERLKACADAHSMQPHKFLGDNNWVELEGFQANNYQPFIV